MTAFLDSSCSEIELSDDEVELFCSLTTGLSDKVSVSVLTLDSFETGLFQVPSLAPGGAAPPSELVCGILRLDFP